MAAQIEIPSPVFDLWEQPSSVRVIVVSNRVARVEPDDPIAGGLAAALLPVIKDSGAIWVGSSGQATDAAQARDFAKIESLGAGALVTVDIPAKHYRGYYEGFGAAFAARSHPRHRRRLYVLSRDQCPHGPRTASLQ